MAARSMVNLGKNLWLPDNPPARLDPQALLSNAWLIGQTGKSTLLYNLAIQLAYQDVPFCFLDPLSTSVPALLHQIPKKQIEHTVYLNPLADDIIPWNPLDDLQLQQDKVASQMVSLFKGMLDEGAFMNRSQDLLKMSLSALSGFPDATLLHIEKLLNDDSWRRLCVVPKLTGSVHTFWDERYERWIKERERSRSTDALENKLRIVTIPANLKEILCAKERISPRHITQGKIFLADLQGYELGELETTVLASLLLARVSLAATQPYIVLIDNAGYISSDILTAALANPRLGVVVAHTYGAQVDMDAIMSHTKNLFVFEVNTRDARELENLFPANVQMSHLVDQRPFTCYAKLGQEVFRLETLPPFGGSTSHKHKILQQSRERYSRSRTAVQEYLRRL